MEIIKEALLSEKQAAKQIGVAPITLSRKRKEGKIAYFQVGFRILYHPDHLAEYLAKCEKKAREVKDNGEF